MKRSCMGFIAVVALLVCGSASADIAPYKKYQVLAAPQTASKTQIEVRNFFFYACSHCNHLHEKMAVWEQSPPADVNLIYSPVIFRSDYEPLARAYLALESLGKARRLHGLFFKGLHEDKLHLNNADQIADFVAENGVDRAQFLSAYNSPDMQSKVAESNRHLQLYAIRGTPTLVVDGRYVITGLQPDDTMRVLAEVIDIVRKERAQQPPAITADHAPQQAALPKPAVLSEPQTATKPAKARKMPKAKTMRAYDLDLRHCLELTENAAIARCAGE